MTTYPNLSHEMNAALSRVQLPPSSIDKISAMQDASDEDQELSRAAVAKVNQARNRVAHAQGVSGT